MNKSFSNIYTNVFTPSKDKAGIVNPPQKMTVLTVTTQVVEKKSFLTSVTVLRIDNANAIAPRRPENHNMCWN